MATKKEIKELSQRIGMAHGWNPLGLFAITVESRLTATEREELGKSMAELVGHVDKLEEEKKAFNNEMKEKIDEIYEKLSSAAFQHRSGVRMKDCDLIAFYDHRTEQRHYCDLETGEIVKSAPAEKGDEQMKLGA